MGSLDLIQSEAHRGGIRSYNHPYLGPMSMHHIHMLPHPHGHRRHDWNINHLPRYMRGVDSRVIACGCTGNMIGCLPVCAPALMALAAALIAALKSFIHSTPQELQQMAGHAQNGIATLVSNVSQGIDAVNGDLGPGTAAAMALNNSGDPRINVSAGTDPITGQPSLAVNAVDHPIVNYAGQHMSDQEINNGGRIDPNAPDPGSAGESGTAVDSNANALINIPAHAGKDIMRDVIGPIKDQAEKIWAAYKVPIMFAAVGYGAYKYKTRKKKGRR